jgi:aspartate racemase
MKTCAIIGGMGPEATAVYYMKIMERFQSRKIYPPVLMYSVPESFEVTDNLLKFSKNGSTRLALVLKGLEVTQDNADFCVIPCNTAHIYIDEIRKNSAIPVISIVEETCDFLYKKDFKKIGILATKTTIDAGLYTNPLLSLGMTAILPDKDQQFAISEIIVRLVKGEKNQQDKVDLLETIYELKKNGAECIVLACTDLPLLIEKADGDIPIFDTMDILADAAVQEILDLRRGKYMQTS